ncbi:hypothetical protein V8Q13_03870 [Acinetobacter baumannii]
MAISDSHRLGQLIGIMLEKAIKPQLQSVLGPSHFLDSVSTSRAARGKKKKVSWKDSQGNKHDLDFVIEQNGTDSSIGNPKAFIECAWRRYTKHSKNKAQEIQGAIIPLAETYANHKPFLGAILAGDFTTPSLQQLTSHGFHVLYITYQEIVQAYTAATGLDISYNEKTSLEDLKIKADAVEQLSTQQVNKVTQQLIIIIQPKLMPFLKSLQISLTRTINKIVIQPLYGDITTFSDISSAQQYLSSIDLNIVPCNIKFDRIFIFVEYSNGENFRAEFFDIVNALDFLAKH